MFQARTCCFFLFNDLRCKVVVRFVDIGGIVVHHCLNFLFIINCIMTGSGVFTAIFNNILFILEEMGVHEENHKHIVSY